MRKTILPLVLALLSCMTSASAQVLGTMELTLAREGNHWSAASKFDTVGHELLNPVRDLVVRVNEITFVTMALDAELHFSGKITNDTMAGTIEGFQRQRIVAAGNWSLRRDGNDSASDGIAGKWVGSFMLQPGVQEKALQLGVALEFNATVGRPAYADRHPNVLFDEGHNNSDTSTGSYKPFADLIVSDGYRVAPGRERFSNRTLAGYEVLVIVNASGPYPRRDGPAFTEEECEALRDWVNAGGALLLITDNAPYSAAVAGLSKRFGAEITTGHTIDPSHHNQESGDQTELVYTRDEGLVIEHPITQGRDSGERINRIETFTGTSVKGPQGSVPFLKLADTALDVVPPDRKPASPADPAPDHKQVSAAGRAQGIAFGFGNGRVVVLCDAAMLTSQVTPQGFRFGMGVSGIDNRQLALNIMHWLSRLLT